MELTWVHYPTPRSVWRYPETTQNIEKCGIHHARQGICLGMRASSGASTPNWLGGPPIVGPATLSPGPATTACASTAPAEHAPNSTKARDRADNFAFHLIIARILAVL